MRYQPDATIIAIGDSTSEAQTLRLILESLGCKTDYSPSGNPDDFLAVLTAVPTTCRVIVICAHGDENGLVFGEFSPEVDTKLLIAGSLPARHLELPPDCMKNRLVLTTACATGTASFATSFLSAGATAFLAPADYPDGEEVVLFIHALLHQLFSRKKPLAETWKMLTEAGLNTGLMTLSRRLNPDQFRPSRHLNITL